MTQEQIAISLFAALLASASLLVSAFGTLYSVYARAVTESSPICYTIRKICYALAFTILLISLTEIRILVFLSLNIEAVVPYLQYVLFLIVGVINVSPMVISWRMYNDNRA